MEREPLIVVDAMAMTIGEGPRLLTVITIMMVLCGWCS